MPGCRIGTVPCLRHLGIPQQAPSSTLRRFSTSRSCCLCQTPSTSISASTLPQRQPLRHPSRVNSSFTLTLENTGDTQPVRPDRVRFKPTGAAKGFRLGICRLVECMRHATGHIVCLLMCSCEGAILLSWYQHQVRIGSLTQGSWSLKDASMHFILQII